LLQKFRHNPLNCNLFAMSIDLLGEIQHFLDQRPNASLEITFAYLDIHLFNENKLLNRIVRENAKLRIHTPPSPGMPQMEVLDHLVFQFSFWFGLPTSKFPFESNALGMPRPLARGFLQINTDELDLQFTIEAPDPKLHILVQHCYVNPIHIKQVERQGVAQP